MNTEKNLGWAKRAAVAWRPRVLAGVLAFPCWAWASTEAAGAASTGPDLSGVGRVLGMMLK